jgi:hypothetical protein
MIHMAMAGSAHVHENNNLKPSRPLSVCRSLTSVLSLGFKFLGWLNGLGILLVIACSLGVIQTDLTPYLLRLPLAVYLGGILFCGFGLLWFYAVQVSLCSQAIAGRIRRTHWFPMFCAMIAYSLSLLAFVLGCWSMVNLAGLVYQDPDSTTSADDESASPLDQSGEAFDYTHNAIAKTVLFAGKRHSRF